ncbi:MAG: alpha/beta hydrolase [Planctomycetota bacterium]
MPLHPQAQAFVDSLAEQDAPSWQELGPVKAREGFRALGEVFGSGPELPLVKDVVLDGDISARLYKSSDLSDLPVVVFFHGGGWVLGDVESHDALCRRLASEAGIAVVSVDYDLAPENSFPGPMDQCYRATSFISANGESLGVDSARLMVAGDSAGGNLAGAVAIRARDESGPAIDSQILIYPVISPDFDTGSYLEFADGHGLTRASMQWFWECYLAGAESLSKPLADLGRHDLAGLPPALVITCEYDVLRDEGESYADRLKSSQVEVQWSRYEGMLHGFIHFASLFDDSDRAIKEVAAYIGSR